MRSLMLSLALLVAVPASAAPRSFGVEVSGQGPPVILIPGLACGGAVWDATVARYRGTHQLHVLTLSGFAGRKAIAGPLLPAVRDELAEYIKAHKLARPIIVGHSLGGFLALWLAATEPGLVGKVVVVDAVPFLPALMQPAATVEMVKGQAAQMRDLMTKAKPEDFAAQNQQALAGMVTNPKDVPPLAAMGRASDQGAVAQAMYDLVTTDLRPELAKITAPTLVLAAKDAPDVEKTFGAQYAALRGVKIVAAPTRHFVFVDDPRFFFAQLDGWIK